MEKRCFVPVCKNTSANSKNIFISVPTIEAIRKKWFEAVKRNFSASRNLLCCEVHFNLEDDAENWKLFKFDATPIKMKRDVVPHKFVDSESNPKTKSILSESEKKRKLNANLDFEEKWRKEQYVKENNPASRKVLKQYSVPSCNLPEPSARVIKHLQKRKDLEKRKIEGLVLPPGRNKKKQLENRQEEIKDDQISPGTSSENKLPIKQLSPKARFEKNTINKQQNPIYYEIPEAMVFYYELEEILSEPEEILPD